MNMILQLKITLRGSKPPIWRRVEVRDSITFSELHRVIQESFDWLDDHLHGFEIRRSNSVRVNDYVSIGPIDSADLGIYDSNFDYDEEQALLKDVLIKEKDRVWYTYDFGDNWEHDVVLEKFLSEEVAAFYPRCTKAMRGAPEEDSRFEHIEGIVTEDIDPKILREEINDSFLETFDDEESLELASAILSVSHNKDVNPWSRLLDIAEEFHQLQPWIRLDDDDIFVVEHPKRKKMFIAPSWEVGGWNMVSLLLLGKRVANI